jgi:hypothetical protein
MHEAAEHRASASEPDDTEADGEEESPPDLSCDGRRERAADDTEAQYFDHDDAEDGDRSSQRAIRSRGIPHRRFHRASVLTCCGIRRQSWATDIAGR